MLIMLRAKLAKPDGMADKEFYGVWKQESEAALKALKAGLIKDIYKVAGTPEVVAVVEVKSGDDIDNLLHEMPIWKLGYCQFIKDVTITPLRSYEHWAEDLKRFA